MKIKKFKEGLSSFNMTYSGTSSKNIFLLRLWEIICYGKNLGASKYFNVKKDLSNTITNIIIFNFPYLSKFLVVFTSAISTGLKTEGEFASLG